MRLKGFVKLKHFHKTEMSSAFSTHSLRMHVGSLPGPAQHGTSQSTECRSRRENPEMQRRAKMQSSAALLKLNICYMVIYAYV